MAGKGFNDREILSREDLIKEALQHILDSEAELSRREDDAGDFFRALCGFSLENRVWFILWKGGGAQRFRDILKAVGGSRTTLSNTLGNLLNTEPQLVRIVEGRYQAVSPVGLVHFSGLNRRKI